MTNIIIIHGAYGDGTENWLPWLKSELENLGHQVYVPRFPTPEGQNLENWLKVFKSYEKLLDEKSIVVGHSIGPAFLLSILEKKKAKAAFFVAGFIGAFTGKWADPSFDVINKTIAEKPFDWNKINDNCKRFYLFYSDTDPYVPTEKAFELGGHLGVKPILVKDAGHFNEQAGYKKFELLLDNIKKELD
jgi:predicted alpha/beta hydrolase family esterase